MGSLKLTTASSGSVILSPANTASDVTITVPAVTGTMITTASTFAGTGPAFFAYLSTNQSVSNGVATKVALNVENFDTANCFDSSTNYRFTPNVAGYYQFTGCAGPYGASTTAASSYIYKNGSSVAYAGCPVASLTGGQYIQVSTILYMNGTTDYVELYGAVTASSTTLFATNGGTTAYFTGSLIRAA